jgi:hypothetical protein
VAVRREDGIVEERKKRWCRGRRYPRSPGAMACVHLAPTSDERIGMIAAIDRRQRARSRPPGACPARFNLGPEGAVCVRQARRRSSPSGCGAVPPCLALFARPVLLSPRTELLRRRSRHVESLRDDPDCQRPERSMTATAKMPAHAPAELAAKSIN